MTTPSEPGAEGQPAREAGRAGLLQVILEGGEEVIGSQAVADLFQRAEQRAGSPAVFSTLHLELKDTYGALGGPGVAIRLGRASLKYGLRQWGAEAGLTSAAFRLRPSPQRARAALQKLAELLESQFGAQAQLSEDEGYWFWRVGQCPACRERSAESPDCHLLAGLLQETLAWAGGGRFFRVAELECSAMGAAACLFRIDKKALD